MHGTSTSGTTGYANQKATGKKLKRLIARYKPRKICKRKPWTCCKERIEAMYFKKVSVANATRIIYSKVMRKEKMKPKSLYKFIKVYEVLPLKRIKNI